MVQNVTPAQAWSALKSDPKAQLVDVRTDAEWNLVGVPDLIEACKQAVLLQWQTYPAMQPNAQFIDQLKRVGFAPDHHLYFLCRTGGRSLAAARAAEAAGYLHTYNIVDGFEGNPDTKGHRGIQAGWKASNLPWRQK
jgi:rhodanese-related sulfurtransferase